MIIKASDIKLSPKAQAELDARRVKTEKMFAPLYKELGVDSNTEELHWTSGEVFIINKETRERREIAGKTQPELSNRMMNHAVQCAKE